MQPNATDSKVVAAIMADLEAENPDTNKDIAARHGVSGSTVGRLAKRFAIQITATKQVSPPPSAAALGFRSQARDKINAAFAALDDGKLKKCSASQLAVVIGILRDKIRDIDAKSEESITIRFGDRKAMLSFLSGQEPEPDPAPAAIPATATPTEPPGGPEPAPEPPI